MQKAQILKYLWFEKSPLTTLKYKAQMWITNSITAKELITTIITHIRGYIPFLLEKKFQSQKKMN